MTNYATINGRAVGASGLNAEVSNIKCPICGQKMDIVGIEDKGSTLDSEREEDYFGNLYHTETHSHSFGIKWACMCCTAELTATATQYSKHKINLG